MGHQVDKLSSTDTSRVPAARPFRPARGDNSLCRQRPRFLYRLRMTMSVLESAILDARDSWPTLAQPGAKLRMSDNLLSLVSRDLLLDIPPMPRALIGAGLYRQTGVEAREMGFKRALITTTGLRGTGIVEEIGSLLRAEGVEPV